MTRIPAAPFERAGCKSYAGSEKDIKSISHHVVVYAWLRKFTRGDLDEQEQSMMLPQANRKGIKRGQNCPLNCR